MATRFALVLTAVALQGCIEKPPPPTASHNRLYYEDQLGKAASCTVSDVKVTDGKESPVTMITGGGGWCGVSVSHGGDPYAAGLLVQPPANGKVFVHGVGDDTRIDYTPKPGAPAIDAFAVRLIPGDAILRIAVNPPKPPGT